MTKEELEKEAKESWWNDNNCSGALSTEKIYECGYLASAEPREKRIAELTEENNRLNKMFTLAKEAIKQFLNDYVVSNDVLDKLEPLIKEIKENDI